MLIDWFTVIAQAVNFLILAWLMKRYLYQPILKALDAREQRIAAELADADKKKAEALAEREEFRRKNDEFDRQRDGLLSKATSDAIAEHGRLLDEVRKEAGDMRGKLQDKLDNEFSSLHEEIARRTQAAVFAIARKTLTELSGASLEARMVEVFVRRLRELGDSERNKLAAITGQGIVTVRSAFELPQPQQTTIEESIKATLGTGDPIRFETMPDLIGGIELILQGQKIAWSISDHLASLEKELAAMLKAQRHES
ncbi:ATP synthase subunit b [mine drainage metagenome]|uniref:ATP synthase subunit b n=1 Tax=mine drainage metagenome TaxID=410659 RepID=A0A1J5TQ08_9ZZZZ